LINFNTLLGKIDKAEEKIEGHDIDVVNQWEEILEKESSKKTRRHRRYIW